MTDMRQPIVEDYDGHYVQWRGKSNTTFKRLYRYIRKMPIGKTIKVIIPEPLDFSALLSANFRLTRVRRWGQSWGIISQRPRPFVAPCEYIIKKVAKDIDGNIISTPIEKTNDTSHLANT